MLKLAHVFLGDVMTPYYTIASRIILSRLLNWLFSAGRRQITSKGPQRTGLHNIKQIYHTKPICGTSPAVLQELPICLPSSY